MAAKKGRRKTGRRSAIPLIAGLAGATGVALVALQLLPDEGPREVEEPAPVERVEPAPPKPEPSRRPRPTQAEARPPESKPPAPAPARAEVPVRTRDRRAGVPKVAIVIDDCGYDMEMARRFAEVDIPLTFAVIPRLAGTEDCAEWAFAAGHEVILHQPMEPSGYPATNPGEGALLRGMGRNQVRSTLLQNWRAIPHVSGLNNHMGSAATADAALMEILMGEVVGLSEANQGVYFLDSKTSAATVAYDTARRMGIPTALRSVFLDHDESLASVKAKFQELLAVAEEEGEAIGIGHFKEPTLKALQATIRELGQGEFDFVHASELAR